MPLAICCCCGHLAFKLLAVRSDCGVTMERSKGASKNCLHREVRIAVCYSDIACSCMTWWETPEVSCGCYGYTECMFAMKLRCKYTGCRQPQLRTSTPAGVWAATRGCFASCWSECLISACLASCWSVCTGLSGVGSHPRLLCKL